MSSEVAALAAQLERRIEPLRDVLVAVSGGVDSTVVAELAFRSLGSHALIMTADSPAVPRRDIEEVGRLAAQRGWNHRFVRTNELERPGYRQNASDRCYHCKSELFDVMIGHPEARGATVLTGTNAEDLGDHRPGLRAAAERAVVAPLAEAGVDKAGVRALARHLQLPTAERPASPCLASRVAYGVEVDHETLDRIERAESLLRSLGYPVCRVRVHGDVARVEVPGAQLEAAFAQRHRFAPALRRLGFTYVTLDLEGFRSGSLNEGLPILTVNAAPGTGSSGARSTSASGGCADARAIPGDVEDRAPPSGLPPAAPAMRRNLGERCEPVGAGGQRSVSVSGATTAVFPASVLPTVQRSVLLPMRSMSD